MQSKLTCGRRAIKCERLPCTVGYGYVNLFLVFLSFFRERLYVKNVLKSYSTGWLL